MLKKNRTQAAHAGQVVSLDAVQAIQACFRTANMRCSWGLYAYMIELTNNEVQDAADMGCRLPKEVNKKLREALLGPRPCADDPQSYARFVDFSITEFIIEHSTSNATEQLSRVVVSIPQSSSATSSITGLISPSNPLTTFDSHQSLFSGPAAPTNVGPGCGISNVPPFPYVAYEVGSRQRTQLSQQQQQILQQQQQQPPLQQLVQTPQQLLQQRSRDIQEWVCGSKSSKNSDSDSSGSGGE